MKHRDSGRFVNRTLAVIGTAALAISGVVAGASIASAAEVGNINPNIDRSLTVHKHAKTGDNGATAGDGSVLTPPPSGAGVDGAKFEIYLVPTAEGSTPIDLLTTAGWDDVASLDATAAATRLRLSTPTPVEPFASGETANDGTLMFDSVGNTDIPLGLYYVREVAGTNTSITNLSEPFLVTLPYPSGGDSESSPNEWLYAVHVYPKNSVTGIEKQPVTPTGNDLKFGDLVRWNITATVPYLSGDDTFDTFTVTDVIDATTLEFVTVVPTGVTGTNVTLSDVARTNVSLVPADYTISAPLGEPGDEQSIVVSFSAQGLVKLFETQGGEVVFQVLTRVIAVPESGDIVNDAVSVVNDSRNTDSSTTPFGELGIFKFATTKNGETTTQTSLANAKFKLFTEVTMTNQVTVGSASEWTTNADGEFPADLILRPGTYWLYESQAPAGYEAIHPNPMKVTVVKGQMVQPNTETESVGQNWVAVENFQVPPVQLPLTGSTGTAIFMLGGLALVLVAGGAALVASRRRHNSAAK